MFVEATVPLALPIDDARVALQRAIAGTNLKAESTRAFDTGMDVLRSVGPRGSHGVTKQVRVLLLPAREVDGTTVVPLRWEATGAAGQLFPALDANLCLRAAGAVTTVLTIVGTYAPPLGRVGEVLDRAVMSSAATASVEALARELAASVRQAAAIDTIA